ncbi:MAG: hypothetical protein HZA36_02850 [Parcubacteria group bacterium]|nr:hypothetical protein [Parcubacteria group bacterium]
MVSTRRSFGAQNKGLRDGGRWWMGSKGLFERGAILMPIRNHLAFSVSMDYDIIFCSIHHPKTSLAKMVMPP